MAQSEPQATPPAEINPIRAQMVNQLTSFNAQVSAAHQKFLAMQQQAMSRLLNLYESVAPGSEAGGASDAGVGQALAQPAGSAAACRRRNRRRQAWSKRRKSRVSQ